ncbi:hypothetical protein OBBRIDRAFT_594932 [Obba rivulosa]|uniref:F-box domain-containing protein n=1 Tax=Obba rivulosa TaxID=1052685 RepID=A0A8E2B1G8_9APHY|nr:hypothetical protein OBBRIDRAFT_594932 [Obba rivulosa]
MLKEPERTEDIFDSLPRGINTTNVMMNPGGLPPEIWYTIMDYIDDGRTLYACALTCKLLAARAMKMTKPLRMCRTPQVLFTDLMRRPIVGYFLQEVIVPPALLPRLLYECAGKLHALRIIRIYSTSSWPCEGRLTHHRPPYLAFASTFHTVTELHLFCVQFWSSRDFLRLICAFPSLRALSSFYVSWDRDEGRTLADEPFAKALRLQKIEVCLLGVSS